MSRDILTPFSYSAAVELSGSSRPRYRKQIMKLDTIRYSDASGTRTIRFDRPYLKRLVKAFNAGAYDQVPFQIADGQNAHNNDPERFRGDLVGVELTPDGIDGIFEPTEAGEQLLLSNPKLGVSCRIVEDPNSPYPAIQHVLGTVNPKLRGMRPWEKVDLSDEGVEQTTDLSVDPDEEENVPNKVVLELSEEQSERLRGLLDDLDASDELARVIQEQDEEDGPGDPDEFDPDTENDDDEDDTEDSPDPNRSEHLALLMARQDDSEQRIIELTHQLRTANVRNELDELARQGLAPAIIKAAQPLLGVPSGAVELSQPDGSRVDPAGVVRDVLRTVLELSQSGQAVVDLDAETGWAGPEVSSENAKREALVDAWERDYGRH